MVTEVVVGVVKLELVELEGSLTGGILCISLDWVVKCV